MPWAEAPPIAHPRAGLAAATCDAPAPGSGQRIYAIGGYDGTNAVATVEAYDTAQKTWSTLPSMPTPRVYLGAASSPGRLHALGGWGATLITPVAAHEIYEPAANAWSSQAAPLPTGRAAFGAVTGPDGLIYVIGGQDPNNPFLATVEAYDPAADTWITKAPMNTPRRLMGAVAGPDGLIYAIGGGGAQGALNSVEVFNISANTWTLSPHPLPAPTCLLGAAVDSNGLIYAIGGFRPNSQYAADVYSYDPTAPGWAKRPPLLIGRAGPAADTGPDGLVYAIGGNSYPSGAVFADVEAYTFDKCDYIEFQISLVGHEIDKDLALLELPELTPQQRAEILQQIASLRAQQQNLLVLLKDCWLIGG
jgi:N-acetylneuraminic acid mutarotase